MKFRRMLAVFLTAAVLMPCLSVSGQAEQTAPAQEIPAAEISETPLPAETEPVADTGDLDDIVDAEITPPEATHL